MALLRATTEVRIPAISVLMGMSVLSTDVVVAAVNSRALAEVMLSGVGMGVVVGTGDVVGTGVVVGIGLVVGTGVDVGIGVMVGAGDTVGCGDVVGIGVSMSGSLPIGLFVSPVEPPPPPQAISVVLTSTALSRCLINVLSPKTQK